MALRCRNLREGGNRRRGTACVLAAAAMFFFALSAPAGAQFFDFLFGGRPEQRPAPSGSGAAGTSAPQAKPAKPKPRKPKPTEAKAQPDPSLPAAAAEGPPPPYETNLLRLAEILGALAYFDELCAAKPSGAWGEKMHALLAAEGTAKGRKERLAGSYNRGFRDYERTYHVCTPNAHAVMSRFLAEGSKLAHDVVSRYGRS